MQRRFTYDVQSIAFQLDMARCSLGERYEGVTVLTAAAESDSAELVRFLIERI